MNKKVFTLCAGVLLASSLTALAQVCPTDGEYPYRSRVVKSALPDAGISQVTEINGQYYYQLEVDPRSLFGSEIGLAKSTDFNTKSFSQDISELSSSYVLTAERDYSTGKIYLTAKYAKDAVLTHSLWQIKETPRSVNGRVFTFVNKETGYELAFDHTDALPLDGNGNPYREEGSHLNWSYDVNGEANGCITHWAWYTTDEDYKPFEYRRIFSYFHNQTDSVVGLMAIMPSSEKFMPLEHKDRKRIDKALQEENVLIPTLYIVPVKDSKKKAGDRLDTEGGSGGGYPWLAIRPIVAGAKVLNAAEINTMIDANDSYLTFADHIRKYDEWKKATLKAETGVKTKFTVHKPGTREVMTFATGANPFLNQTFKAIESADTTYRRTNTQSDYAGYDVLFEDVAKKAGYLYVAGELFEDVAYQHIYNGVRVKVEPYRYFLKDDKGKTDIKTTLDYDKDVRASIGNYDWESSEGKKENQPVQTVDAIQARYHWKVTYYPTNDSLVFEPLNASRISTIDQQAGKKIWEAEVNKLTQTQWLNTINKGVSSNLASDDDPNNAGSDKAAGVPVALYALNIPTSSGDLAPYLTVGYAEGDKGTYVNPADSIYSAVDKRLFPDALTKKTYPNSDNPAWVTNGADYNPGQGDLEHVTYQAKQMLVVRFDHNYADPYMRATLSDGLYFINIKDVKYDKSQTENRVENAFVVEDMKGHVVYDTQDDAQNFLHMPATQWVVEQLQCNKGDDVNFNMYPKVMIHNREFANEAFEGQLFMDKETKNYVILNHRKYYAVNGENVDDHDNSSQKHKQNRQLLSCSDQMAFTDITKQQTTFGYFNASEAELRESTYMFQHMYDMSKNLYIDVTDNGLIKLTNEGTEFELYRANGWTPVKQDNGTYNFIYKDSIGYGYAVKDLVDPLYKTYYKVKVKDANLIDNDHMFLAITNQHKYVIAEESEIEKDETLVYAVVELKENNHLEDAHGYAFVNAQQYSVASSSLADLKGLTLKDGKYYNKEGKVMVENLMQTQVSGKLTIEGISLNAKIADLCETSTDAFALIHADRKLYRTLPEDLVNNPKMVIDLRTIDEQGAESLYEDSSSKLAVQNMMNYLAAENKGKQTTNEGFYVDKVAKSTTIMPQYLLVVHADSLPLYTYCNDKGRPHGINPGCHHEDTIQGYVEGRFLVNFNDSVKKSMNAIDKLTKKADKYKSSNYVRLGFIEGVHQGDMLYLMKEGNMLDEWKEKEAHGSRMFLKPEFYDKKNIDKVYMIVNLDGKHNNVAFSFRETGDEDESFLIESNDMDNSNSKIGGFGGAWIKLHNNVPVLTQYYNANGDHNTGDSTDAWKQYGDYVSERTYGETINQAARFTFKSLEKDAIATGNEKISATDVTVAGVAGAVVVKGAAGKSVVITNILGQTLATAVLASDNASISVPAGIAVVAVEGEEAAKVVVK
jgi:hypothetical protein